MNGACANTDRCRSELARDELKNDVGFQANRVIVDDHRRNAARSELAPTEEVAYSNFHQKWKLVLSKAVRPAA